MRNNQWDYCLLHTTQLTLVAGLYEPLNVRIHPWPPEMLNQFLMGSINAMMPNLIVHCLYQLNSFTFIRHNPMLIRVMLSHQLLVMQEKLCCVSDESFQLPFPNCRVHLSWRQPHIHRQFGILKKGLYFPQFLLSKLHLLILLKDCWCSCGIFKFYNIQSTHIIYPLLKVILFFSILKGYPAGNCYLEHILV